MFRYKTKIKWDKLEIQRIDIIQLLNNLESNLFAFRISGDSWNLLEILQHLILSERLSLIYLKKKWYYTKDLPPKTFLTVLRSWALLLSMWSPIPLKAPDRVNVFNPDLTAQEIIRKWEQIRSEMKNFLEGLSDEMFDREFYKHPAVGKLTLDHMIAFFYAHCKRHQKQILQILAIQKKAGNTV